MAFRILARLAVLIFLTVPAWGQTVSYLPVNTYDIDENLHTDGLVFFFDAPAAPSAEITVDSMRGGKPICETQVIDTDGAHGERLVFNALLDPEYRHNLYRLRITIGGYTYTFANVKAGVPYPLTAPRKSH